MATHHGHWQHQGPQGGQEGGDTQGSLTVIGSLTLPSSHASVITILCFRGAPASWYNHSTDSVLLSLNTTPAGHLVILLL